MAESEVELKSLLKEESEKVGFKLNTEKMRILASGPITLWQMDGEKMEGPWISMLPYSYGIFWLSMSLMNSFYELSPELAAMET